MTEIRVGVGGWTFKPWRGVFYPKGLTQKRELEFASRALTSIEINGTYYSTFKPDSWRKWREETPDDFVFSVKASRYCTNRKVLSEAGAAINRFIDQGLTELGPKLGPINWQLPPTKKFDKADMKTFLSLLPKKRDGQVLRHAIEARHASFAVPEFYDLARKYKVAIVYACGTNFPEIDVATANFTYARMMVTREDVKTGFSGKDIQRATKQVKSWSKRGDVFAYFIAGAKAHNPAAAQSLLHKLSRLKS
jgi:uncharacterized protein YecE (DUF72 family)